MSDASPPACPACGATAAGKFCSQCGTRMGGNACGECGSKLTHGAMYCGDCGSPVAARARKPAIARLPWILSAAVLLLFSIVIAQLVQSGAVRRTGDMTVTGGIPTPAGQTGAPAGEGSAMPSLQDLASMTPRQAADRLFERSMREWEGGDMERAAFFLDMGLQAYAAVPPADMDIDGRFHMGMMQLLLGDSTSARLMGSDIIDEESDNLLGLTLLVRAADAAGDAAGAAEFRDRLRAAVEEAGGIPDHPDYVSHRPMIENELEETG